jgi:NADPH2:quinone reductase
MPRILHRRLGTPVEVLELTSSEPTGEVGREGILIRVTSTPIHPGDLLGVLGSPAFGAKPDIGEAGRVPGFEGAGVVERIGPEVDPKLGIEVDGRVAFFPVSGAWSSHVVAQPSAVVRLPNAVPDVIGAQMLINTITAEMIARAGHESLRPDELADVTVIQTGAGSAVGVLLSKLLSERDVKLVRLVRSEKSAETLRQRLDAGQVFATDSQGWQDKVRSALADTKIKVAFDGVGGPLLASLAELVATGGTIVTYGSLGGESADIRMFAPKALSLKGVSIGRRSALPPEVRNADIADALRLAQSHPDLFEVAGTYPVTAIAAALEHVGRAGRSGVVILQF